MAKQANVIFDHNYFKSGVLDKGLLEDLFDVLPDDSKIVYIGDYYNKAESYIRVESSQFVDTPQGVGMPTIAINFQIDPLTGNCYIASLDMSAALAAYQPQGPQTSCSSAGCAPGNQCYMCMTNASVTLPGSSGLYPGSSSPTQAIPSPRGQITYVNNYTTPILKIFKRTGTFGVDLGTPSTKSSCSHKWKSYRGLNEQFDYCETCNVKRA